MQERPLPVGVQSRGGTAARPCRLPLSRSGSSGTASSRRLVRLDARAADLRGSSSPLTARALSRTNSASSRRGVLRRQQPVVRVASRSSGRSWTPAGRSRRDHQPDQLLDVPAARGTRPPASRAARGASATRPARRSSSITPLRPLPKNCFQSRLTKTRAVSGFSGATIHFRSRPAGSPAVGIGRCGRNRGHGLHDRAGLVEPVAARQDAGDGRLPRSVTSVELPIAALRDLRRRQLARAEASGSAAVPSRYASAGPPCPASWRRRILLRRRQRRVAKGASRPRSRAATRTGARSRRCHS